MGWILAIGLAMLSLAALALSKRCSRTALEMAGAMLLVSLAGYAWQGSPDMAGLPVENGQAN